MNHWESGPTFPVKGWLGGEERDVPPREYLTVGCLAGRTQVGGKSLEESDPRGT